MSTSLAIVCEKTLTAAIDATGKREPGEAEREGTQGYNKTGFRIPMRLLGWGRLTLLGPNPAGKKRKTSGLALKA